MRRKTRYLVASILSLAKPFLAGAIAAGISMADQGSLGSFFLRYLILAQFLPSVCLFFLYFDEAAYKAFKPLVLLFSGVSLILIVFCVVPIAQNPQKYLLTTQNIAGLLQVSVAIVALFAVDSVDFLTVLLTVIKEGKEQTGHGSPDSLPQRNDNGSNG